jgi:hypothetical protein
MRLLIKDAVTQDTIVELDGILTAHSRPVAEVKERIAAEDDGFFNLQRALGHGHSRQWWLWFRGAHLDDRRLLSDYGVQFMDVLYVSLDQSNDDMTLVIQDAVTRETITELYGITATDTVESIKARVQADIVTGSVDSSRIARSGWLSWHLQGLTRTSSSPLDERHELGYYDVRDRDVLLVVDRDIHCCHRGHLLTSFLFAGESADWTCVGCGRVPRGERGKEVRSHSIRITCQLPSLARNCRGGDGRRCACVRSQEPLVECHTCNTRTTYQPPSDVFRLCEPCYRAKERGLDIAVVQPDADAGAGAASGGGLRPTLVNDEGAAISRGLDRACEHLFYCGRSLPPYKIDHSLTDGRCGPSNGVQCVSCQRFQGSRPALPSTPDFCHYHGTQAGST